MTNGKITWGRFRSVAGFLAAVVLLLLIVGFRFCWFNNYCGRLDIVSPMPHRIVAEGSSWKLCKSKDALFDAYLIYEGKGSPERVIELDGMITASFKKDGGSEEWDSSGDAFMNRHLVIGEKRWDLTRDWSDMYMESADLTVTYQVEGKELTDHLT